jgi:hypothetical protein
MMDRLYEGLPAGLDQKFQDHLATCPACAAEWEAVQISHAALQKLDPPTIPLPLQDQVREYAASPDENVQITSEWHFYSMATAVSFILLLIGAGIYQNYDHLVPGTSSASQSAPQEKSDRWQKDTPQLARNEPHATQPDSIPFPVSEGDILLAQLPVSHDTLGYAVPQRNYVVNTKSAPPVQVVRSEPGEINPPHTFSVSTSKLEPAGPASAAPVEMEEKDSISAKTYFQTGLRLYNTAFTKVGEERQALLQSAVVFLSDLESKFPEQSQWLALALILKADTLQQLGNNTESVATYQTMIRHFNSMEPYCEQARLSIVNLLLKENSKTHQTTQALESFQQLYPHSPHFPKLAFAVADQIQSSSPEGTLHWCHRIMAHCNRADPTWDKASRLASQVEEKIQDTFGIKDFMLVGPVASEASLIDYLPIDPKERFKGIGKTKLQWQRPYPNEKGVVDCLTWVKKPEQNHALFAATAIDSSQPRTIRLMIQASTGAWIWWNEEPIYGRTWNGTYETSLQILPPVQMKQGWNQLQIKSYPFLGQSTEWKFSIKIIDENGHFIPDLRIDPTQAE